MMYIEKKLKECEEDDLEERVDVSSIEKFRDKKVLKSMESERIPLEGKV